MAMNKKPTMAATSMERSNVRPRRPLNARMVQNFHLVWLDGSIDEINNDDCRNSIAKLRQVVNTVNTFTDVDECIDFITDMKDEMTFMIISEAFSPIIVPVVEAISQVSSVYIVCENKTQHEKWAQQWFKLKGVYTDVTSIYEALKQTAHDCDHNSISIGFVKPSDGASKENLDQLDQSFMYTQILKEILLTIDFEQSHINEFLTYCREQFVGNSFELENIDKVEKEYRDRQPIWWYTYQWFLYSMVNRALRTMEVDLIIKMGFFVRDLHNHIAKLHTEQYGGHQHSDPSIVYRGQGLSQTDFDQLMKTKGGLMSFNNFLSTSHNRAVAFTLAESNQDDPNLIGVLFEISIDPSISSSPFADITNVSYYQEEEEILFSMHSVFRIGQVKQINKNDRLWQVDLTLTSENDPQLCALTKCMHEETEGPTGWLRLGKLMIKLSHFDKAEELYELLLKQTTNEDEKAHLFHQLGFIKDGQGKYAEAIEFYEKYLEICQKTLPANHPLLATSYHNIGWVYYNMGEYSKALSYYKKALESRQKTLPANHPLLASSYNNIGQVCCNMGEYSEALSYYEKALEIWQKTLPANHPDLATSYNNIGQVYKNMGEYSKALSYYEKDLEISRKTLPANHPNLATSYNNIGEVYRSISEYSKALSYYEKALEIRQKTLPANHPDLANSYNNIGQVYKNMGEYSKALSYYKKALEIQQKTLPANHPYLAISYNNIGGVYGYMGEYSKALSYCEKALEIQQKTLPANHPDLATSYNNIGGVYGYMGEYSKALSYYEKALEIQQKTLPANHPYLAISYNNIGGLYDNMGEYSKALSYYEKALESRQKTLPANHPHLATSYNNIGEVYYNMSEYSKALSYYEKALEIQQKTLPANHSHLAISYNNIGGLYYNMSEYSKALSYYEKALEIQQKTLPANHPYLANSYNNIGLVYENMGEYSQALSYFERAFDIRQRSLPLNHPSIQNVRESIEIVKRKL
jgi:tetratricopeptide (TPR) repeat protein